MLARFWVGSLRALAIFRVLAKNAPSGFFGGGKRSAPKASHPPQGRANLRTENEPKNATPCLEFGKMRNSV